MCDKIEGEGHQKHVFVSHTNPVTGKIDWIVQDENYDYIQEIARSGYGDMLHDTDRNQKYYKAIRQAIKLLRERNKEVNVLDIGTGTGLLSMMAAESGADTVTACEAFLPMAKCAKNVMEANNFGSKVKLIPKRSTNVRLDDMEQRANLLVTELFDTELIGEGAIASYTDAHLRLMEEDCVAVPTTGIMYVQAVQSELLRSWNSLQPVQLSDRVSITAGPRFSSCSGAPSLHDLQVDELAGKLKLLSAPVEVFRFDFSHRNALAKNEESLVQTLALQDGNIDAFLMWWDLIMDPQGEIILSCAPCWVRGKGEKIPWRDHWMQALYYPTNRLSIQKGNMFDVYSHHDEYSLWFETEPSGNHRPVCTDGLHVAFSRTRLGQINSKKRNQVFIDAIKEHVTEDSVCLVVSDGSLLPLMAAGLGAKQVFYIDMNRPCCRIIEGIIEHNGLQDKICILDKRPEDIIAEDLFNLKIDLVLAEPFSQAAHLPWEHLYFWYALNSIRSQLCPNVKILPESMTVKSMAVQFRDLHKIRAPVGFCEGFDISEFDKLIESSSASADEEIEPQCLWEYPCQALSPPAPLAFVDFSQPVESTPKLHQTTELECCREGVLNGVVFWTEFSFGEESFLSNGLLDDKWQEDKVKWDMFSRQGVKLMRQGRSIGPDSKISISTQFIPEVGDFTFTIK
ncbi:protein arginine N-methyltransferase 7-like [Plakobranchus ocellatus]|uniref:Protein arginine N-methyltransferase n=1 Tax=Plakobranchus ocellatus TaxID=259542 RepID=A0AAV4A0U3_9GAST|nr:protein arginine N-methyltransferase 7-like [Plakobranchus ocellatus]